MTQRLGQFLIASQSSVMFAMKLRGGFSTTYYSLVPLPFASLRSSNKSLTIQQTMRWGPQVRLLVLKAVG
eukprot:4219195-Alexandrium_andersonii.AAC.1